VLYFSNSKAVGDFQQVNKVDYNIIITTENTNTSHKTAIESKKSQRNSLALVVR
jgi:hypothetical protein